SEPGPTSISSPRTFVFDGPFPLMVTVVVTPIELDRLMLCPFVDDAKVMVSAPLPAVHASTALLVLAACTASRSVQFPLFVLSSALVFTVIVAARAWITPAPPTRPTTAVTTNATAKDRARVRIP